jgi:hypothetical protein
LAVTPFPDEKAHAVINIFAQEETIDTLKHAFWAPRPLSSFSPGSTSISTFRFVGEFKHMSTFDYDKDKENFQHNRNKLLNAFATGQCQLRALGIRRQVIWGATWCAFGFVEVLSAEWYHGDRSVSNHCVPFPSFARSPGFSFHYDG